LTGYRTKKTDSGLHISSSTDKSSVFYLWHKKCRAGSIEEIKTFNV